MSDSAIVNGVTRTHSHHAEARALHGDFHLPLKHVIEPQATAALEAAGGYLSQHALPFRSEGVVSYRAAHTQVAGNKDKKADQGWSTVSTSVVEGLNILEVLTADRVVAQVFAEYPLEGYIPKISFLGTRFENLRIAGVPVDVKLNIDFFGDKPARDGHYTKDAGFIGRVGRQAEKLLSFGKIEIPTLESYKLYNQGAVQGKDIGGNYTETIECSLVDQIEGNFPGTAYGHALFIPHFGTVHLATVKLLQHDFVDGVPHKTTVELTMIDAALGCIGHGSVSAARSVTNGSTSP